jgi:hypothetical protein
MAKHPYRVHVSKLLVCRATRRTSTEIRFGQAVPYSGLVFAFGASGRARSAI